MDSLTVNNIKDAIPEVLHGCNTWLNWMTFDKRHGKAVPPYKSAIPKNGRFTVDPLSSANWVSLDAAIARANSEEGVQVGISLTDQGLKIGDSHLWSLDFDGFSAPEGDDDGALEFARKVRTYTEFSPSGTGFKMYLLSDKPPANTPKIKFTPSKYASLYLDVKKYQERAIEVFSKGRFLAMTGTPYFKEKLDLKFISNAELHDLLRDIDQWAKSEGGEGMRVDASTNRKSVDSTETPNAYGKLTEPCLKTVLALIDHNDEQVWWEVCLCLARAYGESGRSYFLTWSKHGYGQGEYASFSEDECNVRFDRALREVARKTGYGCKHLCDLADMAAVNQEWEVEEPSPRAKAEFAAMMAAGVNESIADPLNIDSNSVIGEFNRRHFVSTEGAHSFVFREDDEVESGHKKLTRLTPQAFKQLHTQSVTLTGASKPIRVADYWLGHKNRRTYTGGLVFIPNGACPSNAYNLWRGFGVDPVDGEVSTILDYIKEIVCSHNDTSYNYLVNWLAFGVQWPARQSEVATVIRGLKGTGKSTLGRLMCRIYGSHGMQVSNSRHLVGNFNGHLQNKVFLFADEAFFAGDRAGEGVLKALVTESRFVVEKKGVDATEVPNRLQILMCSNNEWVVPASADERRYFVLDVSDSRRGDESYWSGLNQRIDNGGAEAFLYYLKHIDLSAFSIRTVPNTAGLEAQKVQSFDALTSIVYEWIMGGQVGLLDWHEDEPLQVSTDDIQNELSARCKENPRLRFDALAPTATGRKLKRLIGVVREQAREGSFRKYVYQLPPREEARKLFFAHVGLSPTEQTEGNA
jgi:hypothetical protein